ncbi:MAG: glycosyltransferase [Paenibacillaceae bacterium]|jgi:glycosyltransferase involved in cell wall biosynthesis|nr:glycosyltransferase [Paenibacillaceae bacterium]
MKILFVYYVPSGGVETLNRQRCRALRQYGIEGHCLYYQWGAGMQNNADYPVYVTTDDIAVKHVLDSHQFHAVIAVTDHLSFERYRLMGYRGKLLLEIQGYGPKHVAREQLTMAAPQINAYADGLLNPCTPHIDELFAELFPAKPRFRFNNCFDHRSFTYRSAPKLSHPVIGWLGRLEDNKNWREFLHIGHHLLSYYPDLEMWMFEDHTLSSPTEREQFIQLVSSLKLGKHLTLRSNVPHDQMQQYFSAIGDSGGFLCSTSKVEGAPYAILEAMSCRCPVLSTNSDGVSSSVYHNVTGKYYNLGDIAHAVTEARDLIENLSLREQIRAGAQFHLQNNFNPELYCVNFIAMLQSM